VNEADTESGNPFEDDFNSEGSRDQSELSETKLDKKLEMKKKNPFNKLISKSFSPFLTIYVKSQERNLQELIQRFLTDFENEINQTNEVNVSARWRITLLSKLLYLG